LGRCQKVPKFDFQSQFSMSKIIGIFLIFLKLKNDFVPPLKTPKSVLSWWKYSLSKPQILMTTLLIIIVPYRFYRPFTQQCILISSVLAKGKIIFIFFYFYSCYKLPEWTKHKFNDEMRKHVKIMVVSIWVFVELIFPFPFRITLCTEI